MSQTVLMTKDELMEAIFEFKRNPQEESKELFLNLMEENKHFAFAINTFLGSFYEDINFAREIREKYLFLCSK